MIENGTVTITIGELDNLRKADDRWKKVYDEKTKELYNEYNRKYEKLNKEKKEMESAIKDRTYLYILETKDNTYGMSYISGRSIENKWNTESEVFNDFVNKVSRDYHDIIENYTFIEKIEYIFGSRTPQINYGKSENAE